MAQWNPPNISEINPYTEMANLHLTKVSRIHNGKMTASLKDNVGKIGYSHGKEQSCILSYSIQKPTWSKNLNIRFETIKFLGKNLQNTGIGMTA